MDSLAQVVLATVTTLGCSEATYAQSGFQFRALVCNYDKLLLGDKPVYKIGPSCSACPVGTACNNRSVYPYLCALPDDDDIDGPPIETDEFISVVLSEANLVHQPSELIIHSVAVVVLFYSPIRID